MAADINAGQGAEQQTAEQYEVHITHLHMAEARHQGERHGVRDVAAYDAHRRQQRVEQEQHHHADGARADRGERDECTQYDAGRHCGDRQLATLQAVLEPDVTLQLGFEDQRERGQDHGHADEGYEQRIQFPALLSHIVQEQQGEQGCRQAARRQQANDLPVNSTAPPVYPHATGLGNRGEQQIGADRFHRRDAKQYQQRRHERTATDAGEPDQGADQQAGEYVGD